MRTTVSLPKPLLKNAKRQASERGVTLSAWLEDAVRDHLAKRSRSASRPRFHLHTVSGKLVDPQLDLDRTSALLALEDEVQFKGGR